jgi:AAA ATPase domain
MRDAHEGFLESNILSMYTKYRWRMQAFEPRGTGVLALAACFPVPEAPKSELAMESGTDVVGREDEVAALVDFLDARARLPGVLLLEGEAGVGKTTLWRHGVELAAERGYRVLSCSGSSSETQLSFVALGDLLGDVLQEVLPVLPTPQARGLAVALLVEEAEGSSQDQRAIALAFVGALRLLARSQPVAVAIDDLQWLDRPSAFVLEFALRRLRG